MDGAVSAACWTTRYTTRSWPYLCNAQELALCIGAQIKKEAFMACPHYLASCLCFCDCGWGWSWPHDCPAACYPSLHHHKKLHPMLHLHALHSLDSCGRYNGCHWLHVDTSGNTLWKHINISLYCMSQQFMSPLNHAPAEACHDKTYQSAKYSRPSVETSRMSVDIALIDTLRFAQGKPGSGKHTVTSSCSLMPDNWWTVSSNLSDDDSLVSACIVPKVRSAHVV